MRFHVVPQSGPHLGSSLDQTKLAAPGLSSSMYLSLSLEIRKVLMAVDQERYILVPKSFDEVMDEPLRSSAIQMVEASKEVVIGLSFVTMNAIVGVHNDSSTIVKGKLCGYPTRLGHKQDGKKKKNGGKGMVERFIGLTRLDALKPC